MLKAVYKTRAHAKAALRRRWSRYVNEEQFAVERVTDGWFRIVPDPDGFVAAAERADSAAWRRQFARMFTLNLNKQPKTEEQ